MHTRTSKGNSKERSSRTLRISVTLQDSGGHLPIEICDGKVENLLHKPKVAINPKTLSSALLGSIGSISSNRSIGYIGSVLELV